MIRTRQVIVDFRYGPPTNSMNMSSGAKFIIPSVVGVVLKSPVIARQGILDFLMLVSAFMKLYQSNEPHARIDLTIAVWCRYSALLAVLIPVFFPAISLWYATQLSPSFSFRFGAQLNFLS